MHIKQKIYILILLLLPLLCSCIGVATLVDRDLSFHKIAKTAKFKKTYLKTKYFTLAACYRFDKPGEPVNIYIEGDGNAWVSRARLSNNPTPRVPLVLKLAGIDTNANVAYLARPGQYLEQKKINVDSCYWSDKRFSEEVIASMDEAVGELAKLAKTDKINLIGYSGGGAVAVLIAARREDIISLRTIAGNLDIEAVTKYHNVSALAGSLNPIDFAQKIKDLPQRHFIGSKDTIVPAFVAESFVKRMGDKNYYRLTIVEGATHSSGWTARWKELLDYPLGNLQMPSGN
ncbi:MAG: alpha/beta hydrolase [Candidatus Omnitrophica bacterium]|nr:alpha/beta hydrolase [Candidatus Omnitrophota bacterium]